MLDSVKARGNALVAGQFVWFAAIVFAPGGTLVGEALGQALSWLAYACFAVAAFAFVSLGAARAAHPSPTAAGQLVTTGWYRICRHPVYAFLLTAFLSLAIAGGSALKLGCWFGLWTWLNIKTRFEEQLLRGHYPEYAEYARRVGRFTPWTGRA